jgi:hypothetical protein
MNQNEFPIGKVFLAPVIRFRNCALFPGHSLHAMEGLASHTEFIDLKMGGGANSTRQ